MSRIINSISRLFKRQNTVLADLHNTADDNDRMTSAGFDALLAILDKQQDILEEIRIKESMGVHICPVLPCWHPYWDCWD